jgi:hypothetical protein
MQAVDLLRLKHQIVEGQIEKVFNGFQRPGGRGVRGQLLGLDEVNSLLWGFNGWHGNISK